MDKVETLETQDRQIKELQTRVSELEDKVAAATTTNKSYETFFESIKKFLKEQQNDDENSGYDPTIIKLTNVPELFKEIG